MQEDRCYCLAHHLIGSELGRPKGGRLSSPRVIYADRWGCVYHYHLKGDMWRPMGIYLSSAGWKVFDRNVVKLDITVGNTQRTRNKRIRTHGCVGERQRSQSRRKVETSRQRGTVEMRDFNNLKIVIGYKYEVMRL